MRKTKSTLLQCAALVSLLFLLIAAPIFVLSTEEQNSRELRVTPASLDLTVRQIDVSSIVWDYAEPFIYDGKEHCVSLLNVPEGITVKYENNSSGKIGNYRASYEFIYDSSRIRLIGTAPSALEWTVLPAEVTEAEKPSDTLWLGEAEKDGERKIKTEDPTVYYVRETVGALAFTVNFLLVTLLLLLSVMLIGGSRQTPERALKKPSSDEIYVRYQTSFTARLIRSSEEIQIIYGDVKNRLLSYGGVRSRTSWSYESYVNGKRTLAKVNIKGKTVLLYLSLDPSEYLDSKYTVIDFGANPKYAKTPLLIKVKGSRSLKHAIELIDELMKTLGLSLSEIQTIDYRLPYETPSALCARGLVKPFLVGKANARGSRIAEADVGALISGVHRPKRKQEDIAAESELDVSYP